MDESYGKYYNDAHAKERFEDAFAEACSEMCYALRTTDKKYTEMWQELLSLVVSPSSRQ